MAKIIKVDGTELELKGAGEGGAVTYEQLREAIGGWVELVRCDPEVTGFTHFYCDEEGKLKGLPANPKATEMSTYTMPTDIVCGDVVFCTGDEEGNDF